MISGIYTALMLLMFIGITLWAYSRHTKKTFEDLAQLPLQKDDSSKEGEHHE